MGKLSDYFKLQPKQLEAARHVGTGARIFYGGARGGGKSFLALAVAVITALRFPTIRIMIVRHTFPELEEVFIVPLQQKYPGSVFKYSYKDQKKVAVFKNGSRIIFKALESDKDVLKAQGVEFQLLIIDEAPNFQEYVITKLLGSLRNSHIEGFIPTLLMTGNPGGYSDKYFKTRFIRPNYDLWEEGELQRKDKYVFVSAKVSDNEYIDENYILNLKSMPENLRKAWLDGDWDTFEGAFFETWNADRIICEPFDIPKHWSRCAGFDLGFTKKHPSVCLWSAQDPDTGTVYVYREYAAHGAVETYIEEIKDVGYDDEAVMFVDPSMFTNNQRYEYDESYGNMFLNAGLPVVKANNERINGWRVVKAWMGRHLKIFDTCPGLIATIPTLRYTPHGRSKKEDLDTRMDDDYVDALRYMLVSGYGYPVHDYDDPYEKAAKDTYERFLKDNNDVRHEDWVEMASGSHNAFY